MPEIRPPPPIGHDDHLGLRHLLEDLETDRPLAGDHLLVVEGGMEGIEPSLRARSPRLSNGLVEDLAGQHAPSPPSRRVFSILISGVVTGITIDGAAPGRRGAEGHPLGVVARRGGDHPLGDLGRGSERDLVVGAADLERAGELQGLVLEAGLDAELRGERPGRGRGCLTTPLIRARACFDIHAD